MTLVSGAPAFADDLDVAVQRAATGNGVLQLYADDAFMAMSAQDQAAVLRTIWVVLSGKGGRLTRIEMVKPASSTPLLQYDIALGVRSGPGIAQ